MEKLKLTISSTPHIREKNGIDDIMLDVILALMPAAFAGVWYFGARAFVVMALSVLCCVGFEALYEFIAHKKITVNDYSAVVTGMLLAFILPPTVPFYCVIIGAFVSIVITKQLFGGLGNNFMNPALIGRAFLLASFPVAMTKFTTEKMWFFEKGTDAVTSATPLAKEFVLRPTVWEQFIGRYENGVAIGGCIGETCALAILLGLIYLVIRRVILLRIPLSYLITVGLMTLLFEGKDGACGGNPLLAVLSGGVMLGAVFMATDYVTSPTTKWGQIIFGIGCGALTVIIRLWGGYPEGVTYAILLMNVLTPLLDRWTAPCVFGAVKEKKREE